ncbi:MAG: hemerythrin domain-containing protein [Acidimicrobiia bacterium]
MCDYCDCRSIPLIDALGHDHEHLERLGGELLAAIGAGDLGSARNVFDRLAALLARHTQIEETALFLALAAASDGSDVRSLLDDHEAIDHALITLADADDDGMAAGAPSLLARLHTHIVREEYDVFPAVRLLIPAVAWDEIHERAAACPA